MKDSEWIECSKHIERDSENRPQLTNFFRLIISLVFLFPNLTQFLFIDKNRFVLHLSRKSNYWEIRWLRQYFEFRMNDSLKSYLHQENWWWYFLKRIETNKSYLEPYILSTFHQSLEKPKERKSTGVFFTPINQIKVICHYALFFFLKNRTKIEIDDKSIYQLVFQRKYPVNFQLKDNHQIASVLSSIKILDPSCGTGLFLTEINSLILSIILANPIYVDISPEERFRIINKTFLRLYGYDIDSNSVKYAKLILLHQYMQMTQNGTFSEKELNFFFNKLQIFETNFLSETNTSLNKFDIIIGNPPYVRHHGLQATSIRGLKDNIKFLRDSFPDMKFKWDKKADLYVYFWIKAVTQVVEKGVIIFVLSRAWLSSQYTNPLKQIFVGYFHLDLVLEFPFEVWKGAEIRTHIVVGHRAYKDAKPDKTAIVVWKKSLESLLQFDMQKFTNKLELFSLSKNRSKLEIQAKETDSYRFTLISDSIPLMMNSRKFFPFLRLDYLTMSFYLLKLLIDKKDRFCLL
ncbi:MAG: Eco57I restriction-modification methylase domain-containing protein, partial [Candidatus Hodarchaeota archaeon]